MKKKKILAIIVLLIFFCTINVKAVEIPTEKIEETNQTEEILEPADSSDYEVTEGEFFTEGGGTYQIHKIWIFFSGIATIGIIVGIIVYKKIKKQTNLESDSLYEE